MWLPVLGWGSRTSAALGLRPPLLVAVVVVAGLIEGSRHGCALGMARAVDEGEREGETRNLGIAVDARLKTSVAAVLA